MLGKKCGRMPWACFKTNKKMQYLYVCFSIFFFFFCKDIFSLRFIYSSRVKTGLLKYLNVLNTSELT